MGLGNGARWVVSTLVPVTAFSVQVEGQPAGHAGHCGPNPSFCVLEQESSQRLMLELLSGSVVTVTVRIAQGNLVQRSPTRGLAEAMRAPPPPPPPGTMPAPGFVPVPGPAQPGPTPSLPGTPTGRPLNF